MLAKDGQDWWRQHTGIYHLAAQGQTTWYGFARAILEHAGIAGKPVVIPVASSEYPSVARRPLNSVMNCERMLRTFCDLPDWEDALKLCLRS
jgi:dTDP-4-dehydrorhamnose reductase